MTKTTTILVTAVGGGVGQTVIRATRMYDAHVRIVGTDADPGAVGLYAADVAYVTRRYVDSGHMQQMQEICKRERVDLLIPGIDPEILLFAQERARFESVGTQVMAGSPHSVGICRDKLETSRYFRERGMPFVRTWRLEDLTPGADLAFPVIAKPADGSASRGVRAVFSWEELGELRGRPERFIVQDYLVPAEWNSRTEHLRPADVYRNGLLRQEGEVGGQVLLSPEGELLGSYFCSFELRNGVLHQSRLMEEHGAKQTMEDMAHALAEEGMRGPLSFQGRIAAQGLSFYELNPRFTGGTGAAAGFGYNAVGGAIDSFVRGVSDAEVAQKLARRNPVRCIRYITELMVPEESAQNLETQGRTERPGGYSLVM
jgi:carbamoyl-phosphate synthase large subunit